MGELRWHGPAKVVAEGDAASVADGIPLQPEVLQRRVPSERRGDALAHLARDRVPAELQTLRCRNRKDLEHVKRKGRRRTHLERGVVFEQLR